MYDPNLTTVNPDYDKCAKKQGCDKHFKNRFEKVEYSHRKALRLAFHDCVGYLDDPEKTGCDGCLNLEENRYLLELTFRLWYKYNIHFKSNVQLGPTIRVCNTQSQFWNKFTLTSNFLPQRKLPKNLKLAQKI